jgi:hypothetical protein
MYEYCDERGIPYERCGKVIVATAEEELPCLERLLPRHRVSPFARSIVDAAEATIRSRQWGLILPPVSVSIMRGVPADFRSNPVY